VQHRVGSLLFAVLVVAGAVGWAPAGHGPVAYAEVYAGARVPTAKRATADTARFVTAEPFRDYTFVPPANNGRPVRLLVALHGTGGIGADMATMLKPLAQQNGWAILAPNMPYRDYFNPELVRRDGELLPRLKATIDALPARTGRQFLPQVVLFGFSRGSQEALRFSLMYPEFTAGVAGLSAGSYTLPTTSVSDGSAASRALPYPYGTADVDTFCGRTFDAAAAQKVAYWIGVGGNDTRREEVPRQWDPYVGTNRLERATRYVEILQKFGAQASLEVFPGAGHEVTQAMLTDSMGFLASLPTTN
jgi:predicted esterase